MQVSLDTKKLSAAVDGNKTYLVLLGGAVMIVLNHFGLIPADYVPDSLKGGDWVAQLYALAVGAAGRSALKKLEGDVVPADQQAKVEALAQMLKPMFEGVVKAQLAEHGIIKT